MPSMHPTPFFFLDLFPFHNVFVCLVFNSTTSLINLPFVEDIYLKTYAPCFLENILITRVPIDSFFRYSILVNAVVQILLSLNILFWSGLTEAF